MPSAGDTLIRTGDTLARLCAALEDGLSRPGACALVGLSDVAFYRAMATDETVRCAVQQAEARLEARAVQALQAPYRPVEGLKDPAEASKAAERLLSRHPRLRASWGERVDVRVLDDSTLLRLIAALTSSHNALQALQPSTLHGPDATLSPETREGPGLLASGDAGNTDVGIDGT